MIMSRSFLAITICAILTIAMIWAPFGFSMIGLIEEWGFLSLLVNNVNLWFVTPAGPLATHAMRPLMAMPFAMAHTLGPDSFISWHLLTIMAFFLKGVFVGLLIRQATGSVLSAAIGASVAIAYPADTMTIAFRTLPINWSLAISLMAAFLFVQSLFVSRHRVRSAGVLILSTVSSLLALSACLIYEAAVTIILIPPLVIFARGGLRYLIYDVKKNVAAYGIWFASLFVYAIYALIIRKFIPVSYQASIYPETQTLWTTLESAASAIALVGLPRLLWSGWRDGAYMLFVEFRVLYAAPILAAISSLIWMTACLSSSKNRRVLSRAVRLSFAGVVLAAAGYLPFAVLPSHQAISQRTFMWAAIGATFIMTAPLAMLTSKGRSMTAYLLFLTFSIPSFAFMLVQHNHYVQLSDVTKRSLLAILSQLDPDKTNVVVDKTNMIGDTWSLVDGNLQSSLVYLRDTPSESHKPYLFEVCRSSGMEWEKPFPLNQHGTCVREPSSWRFSGPSSVRGPGIQPTSTVADIVLPTEKSQQITIEQVPAPIDKALLHNDTSYSSKQRISRVLKMHVPNPIHALLFPVQADFLRWSFGDWWNLDKPIPGSGWRGAGWDPTSGRHISMSWANQEQSTIDFEFHPQSVDYPLRLRINQFLKPDGPANLEVFINDQFIKLHAELSAGVFAGSIPARVLKDGPNEFRMKLPVDPDYFGLSATLDWFEVGERPFVRYIRNVTLP